MSWVAVDKDGSEFIYSNEPMRRTTKWWPEHGDAIDMPYGSIQKLIGRTLTWDDEPVELKEVEPTVSPSQPQKEDM